MPTLDQLLAVAQLPATVLLVLLVAVILVGAHRKWWVPGWVYDYERLRSDRMETAMAALTKSVETVLDDRDWPERDRNAVRRRRDA